MSAVNKRDSPAHTHGEATRGRYVAEQRDERGVGARRTRCLVGGRDYVTTETLGSKSNNCEKDSREM